MEDKIVSSWVFIESLTNPDKNVEEGRASQKREENKKERVNSAWRIDQKKMKSKTGKIRSWIESNIFLE